MSPQPPVPGGNPSPATLLAGLWTAALLLLAGLWVWSPFTGPGRMFLVWSAAAVPLAAWSVARLHAWRIEEVPSGPGVLGAIGAGWMIMALLALSGFGAEFALDELILRRPEARAAGLALHWLPGAFGLAACVAGRAAALEARYRLAWR